MFYRILFLLFLFVGSSFAGLDEEMLQTLNILEGSILFFLFVYGLGFLRGK